MEPEKSMTENHGTREHFEVVVTFNASEEELGVRPAEQVSKMLEAVIAKFHLTSQPHQMGLFTSSNIQVAGRLPNGQDLHQTVEEAKIEPEQVLVLRQVVVSGGRQ
jgi:hypothetical protein